LGASPSFVCSRQVCVALSPRSSGRLHCRRGCCRQRVVGLAHIPRGHMEGGVIAGWKEFLVAAAGAAGASRLRHPVDKPEKIRMPTGASPFRSSSRVCTGSRRTPPRSSTCSNPPPFGWGASKPSRWSHSSRNRNSRTSSRRPCSSTKRRNQPHHLSRTASHEAVGICPGARAGRGRVLCNTPGRGEKAKRAPTAGAAGRGSSPGPPLPRRPRAPA
jgi:hypothetical protein